MKTGLEDLRHDVSSCVLMTIELVGREDELDEELLGTSKQDDKGYERRGRIRAEGGEKN